MKYTVLDKNTMISFIFICQKDSKTKTFELHVYIIVMIIGKITMFQPFSKNFGV